MCEDATCATCDAPEEEVVAPVAEEATETPAETPAE